MRVTGNDRGAMNTLQKSATGRKLLAEAEKRGVKIEFKADNGDSSMGQFNPNTNTIQVENGDIEKMTEVLAHELLHATTSENGNSMNEEKMAFKIGEQVAQEAGVNFNPHDESFWNNHVDKAYTGLKNDNGIMSAINALDLAAAPANNIAQTDTAAQANPFGLAANNLLQANNATGNDLMQIFTQMMQSFMQMFQGQTALQQNAQDPFNFKNFDFTA